jgi:hypothetical protein
MKRRGRARRRSAASNFGQRSLSALFAADHRHALNLDQYAGPHEADGMWPLRPTPGQSGTTTL